MTAIRDPFAAVRLIPRWAWICIIVIMGPVMAWSSYSIWHAAWQLAGVNPWVAWVPAAALDGVMLLMTPWSVNERLERTVRQWATCIVVGAIFGSVLVGFIDHYSTAPDTVSDSKRLIAGLVGAAPNTMAALVVHVLNKVVRQQFRETAELNTELVNLETADGVRAENARRQATADATLRADAQRAAADAATLLQTAERRRNMAATADTDADRLLTSAEEKKTAAEQARRGAEAAAKRASRAATRASVSQPVAPASQSDVATASQHEVSVSQPDVATASQISTPDERKKWTLEALRENPKLRPRDVDAAFPDGPRDGFRCLSWARDQIKEEQAS